MAVLDTIGTSTVRPSRNVKAKTETASKGRRAGIRVCSIQLIDVQGRNKGKMEELQARHRKELRDLQARITQKKKSATKKTRKGINDECENWLRETRERHEAELRELTGDGEEVAEDEVPQETETNGVNGSVETEKRPETTTDTSAPRPQPKEDAPAIKKKPNRQKARLARRAADREAEMEKAAQEAQLMTDHRGNEKKSMGDALKRLGLKETDIRPDGHCLYSVVATELKSIGVDPSRGTADTSSQEGYRFVRAETATYILSHPDDFAPFIEEPLEQYANKIKDTAEWGGQIELSAIARAYGVYINVLRGDGSIEKLEPESTEAGAEKKEIWLAYYQHSYGLGEHYNALRKAH
ncbi:hypothetical protein KEM56_003585 [Ascosphaera pollenicola]|nr:hypothetical protein KEM56_003585 [Ascosphaera pollenicola]